MGRTLGFPTANISPEGNPSLPQNGVYAAQIEVDGQWLPCILNQGRHPTLPQGAPTIEAHILDFSGNLYQRRVTVCYRKFLRPEVRFADASALRAQIARDEADARAWFATHPFCESASILETPEQSV